MEALSPALHVQGALKRTDILVITLKSRLPSNLLQLKELRRAVNGMLGANAPKKIFGPEFRIERQARNDCLA